MHTTLISDWVAGHPNHRRPRHRFRPMAIIIRTIIKSTLLVVIGVLVLCLLLYLLSLVAALLIYWLWLFLLLDMHIVISVRCCCDMDNYSILFNTFLHINFKHLDMPTIYYAHT